MTDLIRLSYRERTRYLTPSLVEAFLDEHALTCSPMRVRERESAHAVLECLLCQHHVVLGNPPEMPKRAKGDTTGIPNRLFPKRPRPGKNRMTHEARVAQAVVMAGSFKRYSGVSGAVRSAATP